jgi:RasGEF domain
MVAIVSGLNAPTVRALNRSWKLVDIQHVKRLNDCEGMIDPGKNFTKYRRLLAMTSPPCVPYLGTLQPFATCMSIPDNCLKALTLKIWNFSRKAAETHCPIIWSTSESAGKYAR